MAHAPATNPIAAINGDCHCSLAAAILVLLAIVLLTGLRAWLRRDKTIHGARLAVRFGLSWAVALAGVGATVWWHDRNSNAHQQLPQQQLAQQADSVCAAAVDGLNRLAEHGRPDNAFAASLNQSERALRQITPPAALARDWRRFVAGFAAYGHKYWGASGVGGDPGRRALAKGEAATVRLGIDCPLL